MYVHDGDLVVWKIRCAVTILIMFHSPERDIGSSCWMLELCVSIQGQAATTMDIPILFSSPPAVIQGDNIFNVGETEGQDQLTSYALGLGGNTNEITAALKSQIYILRQTLTLTLNIQTWAHLRRQLGNRTWHRGFGDATRNRQVAFDFRRLFATLHVFQGEWTFALSLVFSSWIVLRTKIEHENSFVHLRPPWVFDCEASLQVRYCHNSGLTKIRQERVPSSRLNHVETGSNEDFTTKFKRQSGRWRKDLFKKKHTFWQ